MIRLDNSNIYTDLDKINLIFKNVTFNFIGILNRLELPKKFKENISLIYGWSTTFGDEINNKYKDYLAKILDDSAKIKINFPVLEKYKYEDSLITNNFGTQTQTKEYYDTIIKQMIILVKNIINDLNETIISPLSIFIKYYNRYIEEYNTGNCDLKRLIEIYNDLYKIYYEVIINMINKKILVFVIA